MLKMNYDGKRFQSISNTRNGETSSATQFCYHQKDEVVWAEYFGGRIKFGTLLARVDQEGNLDMRYQHLNETGELLTGICHTRPELLTCGKWRLHESWQWTCRDFSKGQSVLEEI